MDPPIDRRRQMIKGNRGHAALQRNAKRHLLLIAYSLSAVLVFEVIKHALLSIKDESSESKALSSELAGLLGRIQDLEYQLNMCRARSAHVAGPISLQCLKKATKAEYGMFKTPLGDSPNFKDGTGGKSSVTQVPSIAVEEGLMHRTPDGAGWIKKWSSDLIETLVSTVHRGGDISPPDYPGSALQIRRALEDHVVGKYKNPRILVGGSISPWVESIVLAITNVPKVWVVDWQEISIQDSRVDCLLMPNLSQRRPRELFDVIITYSSIEHDGLGRYGDPLNPEGDLAAMAEFYELLNPQGLVLVAVPIAAQGRGRIELNLHRMYSNERINAIRHGYNLLETILPGSHDLADRYKKDIATISVKEDTWQYQPLFVMQRNQSQIPLIRLRTSSGLPRKAE